MVHEVTVQTGDSLSKIFGRYLNDGISNWEYYWRTYNSHISDPNLVNVGDTVFVPAAQSTGSDSRDNLTVTSSQAPSQPSIFANKKVIYGASAAIILGTLLLTSRRSRRA